MGEVITMTSAAGGRSTAPGTWEDQFGDLHRLITALHADGEVALVKIVLG